MSAYGCATALAAGVTVDVLATKGLQLIFAVLLMVLGLIVAVNCLKEFFGAEAGSMPDEEPEWTELGRQRVADAAKDALHDSVSGTAAPAEA